MRIKIRILPAETGLYKLFFLVVFPFVFSWCEVQKAKEHTHILRGKTVYVLVPEEKPRPVVSADTSYLEYIFASYDLVNIASMDSTIKVDLRYADTNNFMHTNLYDGLRWAYMTCDIAIRLCNAQQHLKRHDSTLSLLVLDATRPQHIQRFMWDSLNLAPDFKKKYLTPPDLASLHNFGCALDLTIADSSGRPLDMGSGFDEFGRIAEPRYEAAFLASGRLDSNAVKNRRLLRHVMESSGLNGIATEWWHFSLCTRKEVEKRYPLIK